MTISSWRSIFCTAQTLITCWRSVIAVTAHRAGHPRFDSLHRSSKWSYPNLVSNKLLVNNTYLQYFLIIWFLVIDCVVLKHLFPGPTFCFLSYTIIIYPSLLLFSLTDMFGSLFCYFGYCQYNKHERKYLYNRYNKYNHIRFWEGAAKVMLNKVLVDFADHVKSILSFYLPSCWIWANLAEQFDGLDHGKVIQKERNQFFYTESQNLNYSCPTILNSERTCLLKEMFIQFPLF